MKLRLLLCGAALLLAGCASERNPFTSASEQPYSYDLVPEPLPDLTPFEVDRINAISATTPSGVPIPNGLAPNPSGQ